MILPDAVRRELRDRELQRHLAELAHTAYLAGVLDALEIDRERYESFDDETGELTLRDPDAGAP